MDAVRWLRVLAGVTQGELARRASTSQPAVAAYESGRRSPTLRTVERLAAACDLDAVVELVPRLTREDRRSLLLHRALAARLLEEPEAVLARARRNLRTMRAAQPGAERLLAAWGAILRRPPEEVVAVMTDPRPPARDLRQVTPFAGVLSARERAAVYRRFQREESA